MKTIIKEAKTEKRDIQLAKYDEGQYPYSVTYWSRKSAHMYTNYFATIEEADIKFEKIKKMK